MDPVAWEQAARERGGLDAPVRPKTRIVEPGTAPLVLPPSAHTR